MKKLELKQMENVQGGNMNQRNCGIAGVLIVGGLIGAVFSLGLGLTVAAGAAGVAANGNCF